MAQHFTPYLDWIDNESELPFGLSRDRVRFCTVVSSDVLLPVSQLIVALSLSAIQ